jgi:hypothetical protein
MDRNVLERENSFGCFRTVPADGPLHPSQDFSPVSHIAGCEEKVMESTSEFKTSFARNARIALHAFTAKRRLTKTGGQNA